MMARKPTPTDDYTPNPLLTSTAADAFAVHCLQQLVLRGQLPQELAAQAAVSPRTHEDSEQNTK